MVCLCALVFCATIVNILAQAPAPAAAPIRPAALKITTRLLANGLRMVMVEDHSAPIINLQVWYHVGSKDERPGRTGFAHLFEHLMFQGSAHVAPEQHTRIVEAMGGVSNAYTMEDATVFFETFPSNYLGQALWLEADRMGGLTVTQETFASEREVVKEERRLRVDNQPYGQIWEDLDAVAFTKHPYHHPVIGNMDDLNKATVEDVRQFFHTFYRPDNATLVIVGDFMVDDAVKQATEYFGGIPKPAQPIPRNTIVEPPQLAERRVTKSYANTPLPAVLLAYRMPAMFAPDSYPLEMASDILSNGESSMLYRKLVYDDRIAVEVDGSGNFTEDPNLFVALAIMDQGKTATEGEKAVVGVLDQLKNSPVDAHDLEKAKNQQIAGFILGRETMESKASSLGRYAVFAKDPNLINTDLDRYLRVTAADIQRVAKSYFVTAHRTALVVAPPPSSDKGKN
jgi:zinc protease